MADLDEGVTEDLLGVEDSGLDKLAGKVRARCGLGFGLALSCQAVSERDGLVAVLTEREGEERDCV